MIYTATFTVQYDVYFKALHSGIYPAGARLVPDRVFQFTETIAASDRGKAVFKFCQNYWDEYKGSLGQANDILVVDDPFKEVQYSDSFSCSDRKHRYLDELTIERLLTESNNELEREVRESTAHHPRNPLKRKKRRRKAMERLDTNLYKASTGILFYVTIYRSKNGRRCRKNNRLLSKDIKKAKREIAKRFGDLVTV
jgi:hypothetical protein